ncbi:hypothetical protein [Saccharothrix carnea]|uniref:hypothetical protein n=1 Tax=Saccharothrix carnea TaxID=1280637 RepID=UPI0011B24D93|nr:hypothetical protein [Saccharothrix carnea]
MVGRINDWYDDHAHVIDVLPGFDFENDDRPDPFSIDDLVVESRRGAHAEPVGKRAAQPSAAGRKSAAMKPETWRKAIRDWRNRNPQSSYRDCARAVTGIVGHPVTRQMVADELNRKQPAPTSVKGAKSARKEKSTVPAKGKSASGSSKQEKVAKTATKGRRVRRVRKYGTVAPQANPSPHRRTSLPRPDQIATRVVRCDSCDMVVTENGGCRC